MKKGLKVAIITAISFIIIIFLLGAFTVKQKGKKAQNKEYDYAISEAQLYTNVTKDDICKETEYGKFADSIYSELDIDWAGRQITIVEVDSADDVYIYAINGENKRDIYSTKYITNKNKIIKIKNSGINESLEIIAPTNCFENLIKINAPGAKVTIDNVNTKDVVVKTDFGNILVRSCKTKTMKLESKSGVIYTQGGAYNVIEVKSEYGGVTVNSDSDEYYISAKTGNINFKPTSDWIRADIALNAGNINLHLPDDFGHSIEIKPNLKEIENNDDISYEVVGGKYVLDDGKADININSESGKIVIYKLD